MIENFTNQRKFGIELEVAGVTRQAVIEALRANGIAVHDIGYSHTATPEWKVVFDASISPTGCEVVSPILAGREGIELAQKVAAIVNAIPGCVANKSCGFHVHVDAGDFDVAVLRRFLKLWIKHEDSIDRMVAPSRRGNENKYCRSVAGLFGSVDDMVAAYNVGADVIDGCESFDDVRRMILNRGGSRYLKVNVESYWRHRTIEIRQHQGTTNPAKVVVWIMFVLGMFDLAIRTKRVEARTEHFVRNHETRLKWLWESSLTTAARTFVRARFRELNADVVTTGS